MRCSRQATLLLLSLAAISLALTVGEATAAEKGQAVWLIGKNLDGWKLKGPPKRSHWTLGKAKLDPQDPRKFVVEPAGAGGAELINARGHSLDIYTQRTFGDCTVELELMVPKGSNSGVYLTGEYEVQVLDSFGKSRVGSGDLGGIYSTAAPKVNAAKPPGQWQKLVIEFQAARFTDGKKVQNARFVKVTLNGQVIHENVEVTRSTGGGVTGREHPEGPLMLQGNHGVVAYRNIKVTPK